MTIDERWTELLQALFQLAQAEEADKRETAYRVFATTPGIIGKEQEEAVIVAFQKGFKDDAVKVSTHHTRRGIPTVNRSAILGAALCYGCICILFQDHLEEKSEQILSLDTRRAQHLAAH